MTPETARDQAEQYIAYSQRGGGTFVAWAKSKDYSPSERQQVLMALGDLLLSGEWTKRESA